MRCWCRHAEAEAAWQRALVLAQAASGKASVQAAACHMGLGNLMATQGALAAAEQQLRRALTIRQDLLGERHVDVATCLTCLARVLRAAGKHGEAEQLYR